MNGYAVIAGDGYVLLHTIRTTAKATKLAYELYYKKNWSLAAAEKYEVIQVNIDCWAGSKEPVER